MDLNVRALHRAMRKSRRFVAQVSRCLSLEEEWGRDVNALVELWLVQNQNRSLMTKQFTCFAQLFAACSAVVLLQHDHILVLRYAGVDMVHGAIAVKAGCCLFHCLRSLCLTRHPHAERSLRSHCPEFRMSLDSPPFQDVT